MAEKSGVQSVERIFQLIEHLAAHPTGVSLQRLAEETGLAKSTVHRLLASLVGLGYVVQDEENGHYRLTLKMFELSSGIVDSMDIMGVAKAHLERLSQRTGEAVHLVIRDGRDIVYIYKTESGPMRMSSRVGLRSPLYCTGVGKAILATLPGDELEDIWTHSNVQKLTDKTITDLEELRSQLVEVRANGYAIDDEENELILPKAEQIPNDFYRKGDTTIMIDAGYNYDRLAEKMGWLGIDPQSIRHILITHQDTDHVGAVEADSPGLFRSAKLYIGEIENRYLTGEVRRKVIYHLYKLPQVAINNEKVLLHDGESFEIDGIKIECFLVPGHTWGHMVYLIDDKYLFTGDTLWFGADGGYSFISSLAEDNKLAVKSLAALEQKLQSRGLHPLFLTGHTGWTDNFEFAFARKDKLCSPFQKRVPDPTAPYDAYDESDDTEEVARAGYLQAVGR